ncbi:hypothetical protein KS4_10470 [Poriferisphaera corsica]|uniref:PEP-CTERM protein-sorting domain-containing protein n=1 Tax=Poriferisphaera corsica TaxID=2528020 RepID=A0A517YS16_9BACT|nr:hypothetical protein [Poriferisphaera corsica]QDU33008.1 hypothetical protein KS4_10470 [Poriferisphaera corsica]
MEKPTKFFFNLCSALAITASVTAAPMAITNLAGEAIAVEGVEWDGVTYTAHFVKDPAPFKNIFDKNNDGDFDDPGELEPMFIKNGGSWTGVGSAANQIMAALGDSLYINNDVESDSFMIPYKITSQGSQWKPGIRGDLDEENNVDALSSETAIQSINIWYPSATKSEYRHWVTFTVTPVPEPASTSLLALTALPLLMRRRNKA